METVEMEPSEMSNEKKHKDEAQTQEPEKPVLASNNKRAKPAMTVVGIGASAGGLEALKGFFDNVPEQPDMLFVVVMHLSAEYESHLAELLQSHCKLPVEQVTKIVPLQKNRVYVIPPKFNIESVDTHLRLTELEKQSHSRAPIDHFFHTLAETHEGHSIGVVLSGTGSDGSQGLRWINEFRGLTIVQSPEEAEYDGMPRNAIATGCVDVVLPVAQMPECIIKFARISPKVHIPEQEDSAVEDDTRVLEKIFAQVRSATGHNFSKYKRTTILRRIERRMHISNVEKLADYLKILIERPEEVRLLFDDLLITVTEFFRDKKVFEHLQTKIIPEIFKGKSEKDKVRVWSIGCATGEEAYSLAMLLKEEADKHNTPQPQLQIFATDLHEKSLAKAREGVYQDSIESNVSAERLRRFFEHETGCYRVQRELREMIIFSSHNLLKDPPFSRLDLVVCRNMLIYLQRDMQENVISVIHYSLKPSGLLLLLGASESINASEMFSCENKACSVYRRLNVWTPEPVLPIIPEIHNKPSSKIKGEEKATSIGSLHAMVVEQYAPPSVLLNQHHDVVHYSAHAGQYLKLPGGQPTNNIFKLIDEKLWFELRTALNAAAKGESVRTKPVHIIVKDEPRQVILHVRQVIEGINNIFFLVIFDEFAGQSQIQPVAIGKRRSGHVSDLESELELTKLQLQTLIAEHETGQEEMQASNEELQSTNEELRSAMEELETSKEELQSVNEELFTLNQENHFRVEELRLLSANLQNLLKATDIATLFLDRELKIVWFTPKVSELFNILNTDKGRPLSDLTHRLADARLHDDAAEVLKKLIPITRELQSENNRWYMLRILPYRTSEDRIEGVVVTLIDITERKHIEQECQIAKEYAEAIIETLPQPVLVLNPNMTVKTANAYFYEHFKVTAELTEGFSIYSLGNGQWNIPELRKLLEEILKTNNVIYDYQIEHDFESIGRRTMLINARTLDHMELILLGIHDITERHESELVISRAYTELEKQKVRLQYLARELATAEQRERKRLASLLHDDLQQYLVALNWQLGAAIKQTKEESVGTALKQCVDLLKQAMKSSKDLTRELRPPVLYEDGLIPALHWLATEMHSRHGMTVTIEAKPFERRLDDDILAMLFESVRELLFNVVKHTGLKEAEVTVDHDEKWLRVTVSDHGKGFDQTKAEHYSKEGSGLGLFSIRERIQTFGGTMQISFLPDKGTQVSLQVPMDVAVASNAAMDLIDIKQTIVQSPVGGNPKAIRSNKERCSVLVVDDQNIIRQALTTLVSVDDRIEVVGQAADGIEAIKAIELLVPDVVLMDVNMPNMNGIEATRQIHRKWPNVRIVGLSVQSDSATEASMREAGAVAFVSKSEDAKEMINAIMNAKPKK